MRTVSFREVYDLSRRVAAHLIHRGLRGKKIFVLGERSALTPVVYLGVARAGGCYIPMDATLNPERIRQIMDFVPEAPVIVFRSLTGILDGIGYEGERLIAEDLLETECDEDVEAAESGIIATQPLYIIFTSGSTGKPKGVITSHASLMNYIEAVNEVLALNRDDVLGSQSPLDYIASIREIYLPLVTGASTVIIPKHQFSMMPELLKTLNEQQITVLCWSASGMELCSKLHLFEEGKPEHVRKVLFSGSVLPGRVLAEWQAHLPETEFINQYGPTETTASCTYYVVREKADADTVLPIGRPYRNYGIVLLNEDGTETKPGETGEICVSGIGVTLGYYGNPEMTAKCYIQNPLNDKYPEILYKTGDYGRYNEKGELLFCGRKDRLIKLMGHRVELEEIEQAAGKAPGVEACACVFDETTETLCLFYSGEAETKQTVLFLRSALPAFMVPRKVKKMDALPTLPNGKTDYKTIRQWVTHPGSV